MSQKPSVKVSVKPSPWGKEKVDFNFQPVTNGIARYGANHSARYELIAPVNFSPGKKYPLVIGTASYEWTPTRMLHH
jgi:hypothetical protein